jgi:hypothetical protein
MVLLMGASSMSKTFGCGVFFYLDWLRDPEHTTVRVVGPGETHLESNLFSHLVTLHRNAALPVPGEVGALFIGLDQRDAKGAIKGLTIPLGRQAGAGRLQGVKRYPRMKPHPEYGNLYRLRVLVDEIEKVPDGIWKDFRNLTSNIGEDPDGMRIAGAFNPEVIGSQTYIHAEPPKQWSSVNLEEDHEWESKRGWYVVRLDAHRSENVMLKKTVFVGLQTIQGLDILAKSSGGTDTGGYMTFGRAMYPSKGSSLSILSPSHFRSGRGNFLWYQSPQIIAAVDSALEGSDPPMMAVGKYGLATGVKFPPSADYPEGRDMMFRQSNGKPALRPGCQLTKMFALRNGDTVAVSNEIKVMCNALGVPPGHLMLDRTGNGAGVHDLLKEIWAPEVYGLNYSSAATGAKVMEQDNEMCSELYERVYSELWYAFRRWLEFQFFLFSSDIEDYADIEVEFTGRLSKRSGTGKMKVESKQDYKARNGGQSPNKADAATLLLHLVRTKWSVIPSMDTERATVSASEAFVGNQAPVIVSAADRLDDLDMAASGPYFDELDWRD